MPERSKVGDYENGLLFRSFSLDVNFRGQGLSKTIMADIIPFVQTNFPDINVVVLTVNDANMTAARLYQRMGYSDTGRTFMGEKGKQLIFEKWLEV